MKEFFLCAVGENPHRDAGAAMPLTGLSYEREFFDRGIVPAGVDEAGRGPIAGPVVAAAAVVPEGFDLAGVDDSKKMPPGKREKIFNALASNGVEYAVGTASAGEIDETNILQAALRAMERAVRNLKTAPGFLLIDGNQPTTLTIAQRTVVGGDGKCMSIAVASIVAKVTRDRMMEELHRRYPAYNFLKHKGYPTAEHRRLVKEYGPCPEHRKSFRLTA